MHRVQLLSALGTLVAVCASAGNALADAGHCPAPQGLPRVRQVGRLVVESPPRPKPERWLRLRTHQSTTDRNGRSYWEGPEVPLFVPLALGKVELEILDNIPGGYLALYRSQPKPGPNSVYEVRIFSCTGQTLAALSLNPLLSRRDQLEVQDIRYADKTIYFNEACQSYSREAGGRCSALVAADPFSRRVLWRTRPLVSNNVFSVVGSHIVAGYGFTAERDWIHVVRRSDGRVVDRDPLPSSHFAIEVRPHSVLEAEVGGSWTMFQMHDFSTPNARLTPLGSHPGQTSSPTGEWRSTRL
jgi:hypothetical protein